MDDKAEKREPSCAVVYTCIGFSVRRFNDLDGREDIGTRTSGSTSNIDAAV